MSTPRKLPEVAPCPGIACDAHEKQPCSEVCWNPYTLRYYVSCRCGWKGPGRTTERAAILAWNRRAPDADADSEMEAIRLALYWLESRPINGAELVIKTASDVLRNAVIERGEVLPAARKGKR